MVRHLLRDFELAAVGQVFVDAGGAEAVAADLGFNAGDGRPAPYHPISIRLPLEEVGEMARLTFGSPVQSEHPR
jgi:hypothetical protein